MTVSPLISSPYISAVVKSPRFKSALNTSISVFKGATMAYGYAAIGAKYGMTVPEVQLYKEVYKGFSKNIPLYLSYAKRLLKLL